MQTETLIKEFIKRKIITDGTNVNADLNANGIGGYPVRVNKNVVLGDFNGHWANGFERDDAGKDWTYKVKYSDITHVEGMEVPRLAQAYKIKIK